MHLEIGDGCCGEIQRKGLPVVAAVPREVYAAIGTGKEQAFTFGIFADHADHFAFWKTVHDLLPALTVIICSKDIRRSGLSRCTHREVGGRRIVTRGFDVKDLGSFGQAERRNVLPALRIIAGKLNQPIARAGPNHSGPYARRRKGGNGRRTWLVRIGLLRFFLLAISSKVRADLTP